MNAMRQFLAAVLGWAIGSIVFLTLVVFVFGNPLRDWLGSTLGIFVERIPPDLEPQIWDAAAELLRRGIIIPPDALIASITNFYGTLIQVLLGVFAVFGVLSFFAIRWQSTQQAETFAEQKIDKLFESREFSRRLTDEASKVFDLQSESIEEMISSLSTIDARIIALEEEISSRASEDEPSDEEEEHE